MSFFVPLLITDHFQADDLQFDAGDVIEIVEELNADWYKGRLDGREGLLPASYVEKIVSTGRSSKPYKPFGAAYHGLSAPPPAGQGPNEVGLEEKPGQEEKKSKFAAYKGTVSDLPPFTHISWHANDSLQLAHSAVGGVGFGAGMCFAIDILVSTYRDFSRFCYWWRPCSCYFLAFFTWPAFFISVTATQCLLILGQITTVYPYIVKLRTVPFMDILQKISLHKRLHRM